jgi:hypothetical protein
MKPVCWKVNRLKILLEAVVALLVGIDVPESFVSPKSTISASMAADKSFVSLVNNTDDDSLGAPFRVTF